MVSHNIFMKNKNLYIILSLIFSFKWVYAIFWEEKIRDNIQSTNRNLAFSVEKYIEYLLGFLLFVAVVYWLYWWALVLTASWDEEKVKKWRKSLFMALIWIVIIFLAWPLVRFLVDLYKT